MFGNLDPAVAKHVDRELSETMIGYWVQFARAGDPNRDGLPLWPAFEPDREQHLKLGVEIRTGAALRRKSCDALDRIRARWLRVEGR